MSDFSKPEYDSYVALCRELKLEREFQQGDWVQAHDGAYTREMCLGFYGEEEGAYDVDKFVWLPSLSDWLEMLEGAGVKSVTIEDQYLGGYQCHQGEGRDGIAFAATREEAAARLWMAVRAPAPSKLLP